MGVHIRVARVSHLGLLSLTLSLGGSSSSSLVLCILADLLRAHTHAHTTQQ